MDSDDLSYDFLRTEIDFHCSHLLNARLSAWLNIHHDACLASSGVQPTAL